jgi:hypothetical protein
MGHSLHIKGRVVGGLDNLLMSIDAPDILPNNLSFFISGKAGYRYGTGMLYY